MAIDNIDQTVVARLKEDIAETEAKEDLTTLNRTISRFNIWFKWSAIIGSVICLILCYPISLWAFDSNKYTLPIAGLAICVFFPVPSRYRAS